VPLTLRTTLLAALVAGLIGGLLFFAAQAFTTRPLIEQAEVLEQAEAAHDHGAVHAHEWEPQEGLERALFTLAADILIGVGFAFLLVGAIGLADRPMSPGAGLLWGLAGFAVFVAAPALGLPPDPPGGHPADLVARQLWWIGTAAATASGLWAILLQRRAWLRIVGLALLVLPHLVGAPQPAEPAAGEHAALTVPFIWASLGSNLVLWTALGVSLGLLLPRLQHGIGPTRAANSAASV